MKEEWHLWWYYSSRLVAADDNNDEELVILCFDELSKVARSLERHVDEWKHHIPNFLWNKVTKIQFRKHIDYRPRSNSYSSWYYCIWICTCGFENNTEPYSDICQRCNHDCRKGPSPQ